MKKDEQALLRMRHLIKAAKAYEMADPELSSSLLKDFIQISEKKLIRIQKSLRKRICKKCFKFKKSHVVMEEKVEEEEEKDKRKQGQRQNMEKK